MGTGARRIARPTGLLGAARILGPSTLPAADHAPTPSIPPLEIKLARLIVQQLANPCRKIGVREWLEDDLDIRIEASLMNDGVSGVAGCI